MVAAVQNQRTSTSENDNTVARGLPQLFTPGLLEELTAEDPILSQIWKAVENRAYEKFCQVDENLSHFYPMASEQRGILIVDNKIAIPTKLRQACLNWLHRDHTGQMAMLDAADYLWWPKIHSMITEKAEECNHCQATGKNLKSLITKRKFEKQEEPTAANEEVQLDSPVRSLVILTLNLIL